MATETVQTMRVSRRFEVADGVVHLHLEPLSADGTTDLTVPSWKPGAHVDLRSEDGIVRQYSLCGRPEDDHLEVAVLNVPGGRGGSAWVHRDLQEGTQVDVAGPRNHFELSDAPEYLFIAGGIGITPIIAMIRDVDQRSTPWNLVYGGRTRPSMAFADSLLEQFGARIQIVPNDECGLLDLPEVLGEPRPGRRIYSCGPEPMLAALEELMADRNDESLHVERFTAGEVDLAGDGFDVEIASSGKTIHVGEGISIIDALAEAGIDVDFSCREGTCGTCETAVLSGVPDHRDVVLDDEEKAENDVMMICVGRCLKGPLLLDL